MVIKKRYIWLALLAVAAGIGLAFLPEPDIAVLNAPPPNRRIAMLGDSMTFGIGATPGNELPAQLGRLIGREIINAGVPGDTTESAAKRLNRVLASRPGTLIVFLGGNDKLRRLPVNAMEANLDNIIQQAQGAGSMIVLVGFKGAPGDGIADMFKRLAQAHGCLYVPDALDNIFFNPSRKADEIHPNDEGYAVIAERIAKKLRPYLAGG